MDSELEQAQQRIEELENILYEFAVMFDSFPDGELCALMSRRVKVGPFLRAKRALGLMKRGRNPRQLELPL